MLNLLTKGFKSIQSKVNQKAELEDMLAGKRDEARQNKEEDEKAQDTARFIVLRETYLSKPTLCSFRYINDVLDAMTDTLRIVELEQPSFCIRTSAEAIALHETDATYILMNDHREGGIAMQLKGNSLLLWMRPDFAYECPKECMVTYTVDDKKDYALSPGHIRLCSDSINCFFVPEQSAVNKKELPKYWSHFAPIQMNLG